MNRSCFGLLAVLLLAGNVRGADSPRAPAGAPRVVATVNGEMISLADVERQVALAHMQAGGTRPTSQDPTTLLERMITATLIAQEAHEARLDEIPEVRSAIEDAERAATRDLLVREWTRGVSVSPAEVDSAYRKRVRQWVIQPVFVQNASVKEFDSQIKAGTDFAKLAKSFRDSGKARGPDTPQSTRANDLTAPVARILTFMKPGETTPPQPGERESAFIHLFEVRTPDDPVARTEAEEEVLEERRADVVKKRTAELRARAATIDVALLDSIDFEKEGAAKTLRADGRALVQVRGEAPITIADLAGAMERRFFHGTTGAIKSKRVNQEKTAVLEDLINRRVVIAEARRRKIDQSSDYKERLRLKTREILFGKYVERAIVPGITVTDEDLKAFLAEHRGEYTTQEMMRIESLAFGSLPEAESALAKLRGGTDLKWLAANAPGRVDPAAPRRATFPAELVASEDLPEDVRKVLKGARSGDTRLYAEGPNGPFHVLALRDYRAPSPLPFDEVRVRIRDRVYQAKLTKALEETAGALRKAAEVKVLVTGDALRKLLQNEMEAGR